MFSPSNNSDFLASAFEEYAVQLIKHCCYRKFPREDAEEIMQETFIKAWEYMQNGGKILNLRAFLFRTANNLMIDRIRKNKLAEPLSLDAFQEKGIDFNDRKDEILTLNDRIEAKRLVGRLKKSIGESEHNLLKMRFMQGLQPYDISRKTGVPRNTISVRLHRLIKKVAVICDFL